MEALYLGIYVDLSQPWDKNILEVAGESSNFRSSSDFTRRRGWRLLEAVNP